MSANRKSNKPTLESLANLTVAEIAAFPAATLYDLQTELDASKKAIGRAQLVFYAALDQKYNKSAIAALRASGKATGTAHYLDGEHDVIFVLGKKDIWDQAKLRKLWCEIASSGEDPLVYMKQELSIPSAVLANMPASVQEEFKPALTVKPSKPTYRLALAGESGK